jgi:hypothetical protein
MNVRKKRLWHARPFTNVFYRPAYGHTGLKRLKYTKLHFYTSYPKEECRLMIFENQLLRRIIGSKMKEVKGGWGEF